MRKKIYGQIITSHIQCYGYDEKSSKFFCKRAKINYNKKTIVKLHTDNGYITKPSDILNSLVNFIKNCFWPKIPQVPIH